MAWHSKWANIKHRKWAQDAKKWKIFWKHAKLIEIAARWGWDPLQNAALAAAIENAKAENVPNDNIDRAVKKWSWEWKDWVIYEQIKYEWYLPWWIAVIIEVLTDNKNRTVWNVRSILSKNWWSLWESWSVWWMFDKKWEITVIMAWKNEEEFEMAVIDSWAEDYEIWEDMAIVTTWEKDLWSVRDALKAGDYEIDRAVLSWIPNQKTQVADPQKAKMILKVIELLEEDDDVNDVYANYDFPDDLDLD